MTFLRPTLWINMWFILASGTCVLKKKNWFIAVGLFSSCLVLCSLFSLLCFSLNACTFRMFVFLMIVSFNIMYCPSYALVKFFALKSTLSDINVDMPVFLWLLFACYNFSIILPIFVFIMHFLQKTYGFAINWFSEKK